MATVRAVISKVATGGPVMYEFYGIDGTMSNAEVGVATLGAALDSVKALIVAVPGVPQRVTISVTL